jgi:tetratricopeptide (TPR) repeat protein
MLQNFRAYAYKNYAMIMHDLGRKEAFEGALNESEVMFEAIRQQHPADKVERAGAWNGLGSIALLREDPRTALLYIEKALEILPDYPQAKEDRELALKMLEAHEKD